MIDHHGLMPGDPVENLKGVGKVRSRQLAACGIHTLGDLLFHLPLRWEDRRRWISAGEVGETELPVALRGKVRDLTSRRARRRGLTILQGVFEDSTGRVPVVWFNARGVEARLQQAETVVLFGVVRTAKRGGLQLVNPDVEAVKEGYRWVGRLSPVYPTLGSIGGPLLRRLILSARPALDSSWATSLRSMVLTWIFSPVDTSTIRKESCTKPIFLWLATR